MRFDGASALGGDAPVLNTLDALHRKREEEEKRLQRAEKFGIITPELLEQKRQQRAARFGGKEESTSGPVRQVIRKHDEKQQARAVRFGMTMASDSIAPQDDDQEDDGQEEQRKKARAERFGSKNTGSNNSN